MNRLADVLASPVTAHPGLAATPGSRCAMGAFAAMGAEERLQNSFHVARQVVRKLPMTWSPVTESNRRPSPYHGHEIRIRAFR
jgi:hypothetical protein